jgi:hypothetical protein
VKNSDIFGKKFTIDFFITTPNNLIERAKEEIERINKEVKILIEGETLYLQKIEELRSEANIFNEGEGNFKDRISEQKMNVPIGKFTKTHPLVSLNPNLFISFSRK